MSFAKIRESIYRRADGGCVGGKYGSETAIAVGPPRQQSQRVSRSAAKRPPQKGADLQGGRIKSRADRKRRGVVRARKGYDDGGVVPDDAPDLSPDDIASMTHYSEAPNPAAPYMKALSDFATSGDFMPAHKPGTEPKDYLNELAQNPDILAKNIDQASQLNFGGMFFPASRAEAAAASAMLKKGFSDNEIWDAHGVFQGADGKWRKEALGPKTLKIDPTQPSSTTFGEAVDAPHIFENAPQLRDMPVHVVRPDPNRPDMTGAYLLSAKDLGQKPSILSVVSDDVPSMVGTLMHEGQHAIDQPAGLLYDELPAKKVTDPYDRYHRSLSEVMARTADTREAVYQQLYDEYGKAAADRFARNVPPWHRDMMDVSRKKQLVGKPAPKQRRGGRVKGAG
jgi:hypothetical protein